MPLFDCHYLDYFYVTSVGATLPTGQLSNVPWRRTGVKYTNNEAYFDVIEEIDAIIDKAGTTVIAEIQGYVSKLIHKNKLQTYTHIDDLNIKYKSVNYVKLVFQIFVYYCIECFLYSCEQHVLLLRFAKKGLTLVLIRISVKWYPGR